MDKKIFIIEDDANILYSLQAKLRVAGFQIFTNNGNDEVEQVIYEIKKIKPDFVILDLVLPKLDGFAVAKALKQSEETKNIIIFTFTNLSDQDSKSRGVKSGIDYYLLKSELSIDELIEKIKKIIINKEKIKQ